MRKHDNITIEDILTGELVITHFQPIVSLKRKEIIGFEALSRGLNPDGKSLLGPQVLIREAEACGLILDLDRLFRKKAFETFSPFYIRNINSFLSINLESSAIYEGFGSKNIINAVEKNQIIPSSVIIEILESEVSDISLLSRFVQEYRSLGFIIALDDFGAGFSNWDRIVKLRPDLIKLDRSIITGIDTDFYKQEVARSIIKLAHNTGSLVIAEGIETHAEASKILELNTDMFQGFLFGKPDEIHKIDTNRISDVIDTVLSGYIEERNSRIKSEKIRTNNYNSIVDRVTDELVKNRSAPQDTILAEMISGENTIECAYILDNTGIQKSDTVINPWSRSIKNRIFHPADTGCDQSNKDYFFSLSNGNDRYITDPYISTATGNLCITISGRFHDSTGKDLILCIDIKKNEF